MIKIIKIKVNKLTHISLILENISQSSCWREGDLLLPGGRSKLHLLASPQLYLSSTNPHNSTSTGLFLLLVFYKIVFFLVQPSHFISTFNECWPFLAWLVVFTFQTKTKNSFLYCFILVILCSSWAKNITSLEKSYILPGSLCVSWTLTNYLQVFKWEALKKSNNTFCINSYNMPVCIFLPALIW